MSEVLLFTGILSVCFGVFAFLIMDPDLFPIRIVAIIIMLMGAYLITLFFKIQTREVIEELELELKLNRGAQNEEKSVDNN